MSKLKDEITEQSNNKKRSIYFMTIGTVVVLLLIFTAIVLFIGYYGFTSSFEKEYKDSIIRTTNLVNGTIGEMNASDYLDYTDAQLMAANDEVSEQNIQIIWDDSETARDSEEYADVDWEKNKLYKVGFWYAVQKSSMEYVCETMGVSAVYIIVPDEDYMHYESAINVVNENSGYTPWEIGHREETEPDMVEPYKKIYEGSEMEIVERLNNLSGAKPHITSLTPIKDEDGNITGILCVQRFTDGLTSARRSFVQGVTAIEAVLIILIILLEVRMLRSTVIQPIREISVEADRFAENNTLSDVNLTDSNYKVKEIHNLAHALDKLEVDTIQNIEDIKEMVAEKERVSADISLASRIQEGMLPQKDQSLNEFSEFDVHATMTPAKEVAGDFYDFYMIDDTHLVIEIADVSDKGFAAAFFMAISKTLIKSRAGLGGSAAEILSYVDGMISEKNDEGMFVTVWFAIIDLVSGHVDVCNAGHDYPAIKLGDADFVIEKDVHGPPLGFIPGATFAGYSFDMKPGDRIFLYTDGLNEAKRGDGERFGTDRMLKVLNDHKDGSNDKMIEAMADAVSLFVGEEPQFDDQTMLSFTFNEYKK